MIGEDVILRQLNLAFLRSSRNCVALFRSRGAFQWPSVLCGVHIGFLLIEISSPFERSLIEMVEVDE